VEDTPTSNNVVLTNIVVVDLNMFGALMLDGVGGEVDHIDVVTVDQSGPRQGVMQLLKKLKEPACLHHAVGHDMVLRLGTRSGDTTVWRFEDQEMRLLPRNIDSLRWTAECRDNPPNQR
jgi:hypothetical protein